MYRHDASSGGLQVTHLTRRSKTRARVGTLPRAIRVCGPQGERKLLSAGERPAQCFYVHEPSSTFLWRNSASKAMRIFASGSPSAIKPGENAKKGSLYTNRCGHGRLPFRKTCARRSSCSGAATSIPSLGSASCSRYSGTPQSFAPSFRAEPCSCYGQPPHPIDA